MPRKISIKQQPSLLEQEISRIVDQAIRNSKVELAAEDIKVIVHDIMPNLDKLIADKVKSHFVEIGQFIIDTMIMGE